MRIPGVFIDLPEEESSNQEKGRARSTQKTSTVD